MYRDVSPNIKMIIAKYNQNVEGGSSGSNSPVAWRSPVFEKKCSKVDQPENNSVNLPQPSSGEYFWVILKFCQS